MSVDKLVHLVSTTFDLYNSKYFKIPIIRTDSMLDTFLIFLVKNGK